MSVRDGCCAWMCILPSWMLLQIRSHQRHRYRLPQLTEASWVCGMLQRRGRDRVYEESAAIARRLLNR